MAGFSSEQLEKKLGDLNNSQQSIQTLSLWLIHHRRHHKVIVVTWFKELKKAKQSKKLTFMYLANDVIQNSRKKGPEFSKEYGAILKLGFENIAKDCDEKTFKGLSRILEVWESRNIYDKAQIASYKQALGTCKVKNEASNREVKPGKGPNKDDKVSQQQKKEQSSNKTKETKDKKRDHNDVKSGKRNAEEKGHSKEKKARFTQPPPKPATLGRSSLTSKTPETNNNNRVPSVDPEVLIKALQDLENSASSDAAVREKIASLPPEVSDSTLLDKIRDKGAAERLSKVVDEACSILADYNSRLAQELEDRKNISTMLNNFTQNQKEALALAEQKLEEYKDKLKKVTQVRNELKSHLQNLPDLSRLPSVTGLAPLPSACDLFNVGRNAADRSGSLSSSTSPNESSASPADDIGTPNSGIS